MNFKYFYVFLVLSGNFIVKFILNINNEHVQDYSCPRATFHKEKSYLGKAGYLVLYNG